MARLHLNACANPTFDTEQRTKVSSVLIIGVAFAALHGIYFLLSMESGGWLIFIIQLTPLIIFDICFLLYFLVVAVKARAFVRHVYKLDDSPLEDTVASVCCLCCSIAQMGRHTADYETYRAMCCSGTGLPSQVQALSPLSLPDPQEQNPYTLF